MVMVMVMVMCIRNDEEKDKIILFLTIRRSHPAHQLKVGVSLKRKHRSGIGSKEAEVAKDEWSMSVGGGR